MSCPSDPPQRMRHFLASDLDGTLIPLEPGPDGRRGVAAFRDVARAREGAWVLAYVTGRHLEHALEGVEEVGLPLPDLFACDVGTSVYHPDGEGWAPDASFEAEMRRAMGGADADAARRALEDVEGLEAQEEAKQAPFKASFYFAWEDRGRLEETVLGHLSGQGLRARLVVSRDVDDGRGLLDVLPEGGAKDRAVRHMARTLDIPSQRVVFAGDSGNDRAALLAGWGSILVGNAPAVLEEEVRAEAGRLGLAERLHVSRAPYAAGVMEGLRALGFPLEG